MPIAHAATGEGGLVSYLDELYLFLRDTLIPFLIVIATLVFLWGVLKYVTAGGDEDKLSDGRRMMVFGIIGLAVMISMWGLAMLLINTFGVGNTPIPKNFEDFNSS